MTKNVSNRSGARQQPKSFLDAGLGVHQTYFGGQNVLLDFRDVLKADKLIEKVERLVVEKAVDNLSPSQLRNIYDKIVNADSLLELKMIRPQLAYVAARITGNAAHRAKEFLSLIDYLIRQTSEDTLEEFKKFMEMIVAYHKYHKSK